MILDSPERFQLGRVVSRAVGVLSRNWLGFGLSAAFLTLPLLGFNLISGNPPALNAGVFAGLAGAQQSLTNAVFGAGSGIFYLVAGVVLQAALVQATIIDLNGDRPPLGTCLATGLRDVFPLLAIIVLYVLAMILGLVLLIVPAFMVLCAFCVAVPVRVVEHDGIWESLGRSADLTRGYRWHIFGLFLLSVVVAIVIGIPSALASFVVPSAAQPTAVALSQWIERIVNTLLNSAGAASLYYELRLVKEGMGATELAAAFD